MKKKIRFAFVVCAAMAALCSCTNDELVDQSANGSGNGALRFNMQVKNRTRAESPTSLQDTHYEFGVSGFAESVSAENAYMQNYLVAYATPSDTKYSTWANTDIATTWGDGLGYLNGSSYWVYERLGNKDVTGRQTKSAHENQFLKYWDETTSNSYFYAYAPYKSVTPTFDGTNHKVTLNNVSSFYTQPIANAQISGAVTKGIMTNGGYNSSMSITTDRDIINANEVIYAATTVEKANYGNDVPFEFKHANAKIRLAFYTDITSYNVTLTDLVPEAISGTPFSIAKQEGIALTPADVTNKGATTQPTTNTEFVAGYNALTITNGATLGWETAAKSNANLLFKVPTPGTISTTLSNITVLPTEYYAVPAPESNTCGFTVHVSFKLNSKATGTSDEIQVYDARCWIPAANCQWEAGKTYTYIFKITDKSSGTTNPQRKDPATSDEAYIDPSDPRVIETGELHPIEFTAMVLTGFDEVYNGLFNISGDLKTKPIVADPLDESLRYTEYATYGVKTLNEYTFLSPIDITEVFSPTVSISYDPVNHLFTREYKTASGTTVNISFSALSYTNYLDGKLNSAFTYVYTKSDGSKALKITATQPESGTAWTVTTTDATLPAYGHALYIKNLGRDSRDYTVGEEIGTIDIKTFDASTHTLTIDGVESKTIDGLTCAVDNTNKKITLSGTPSKAGIYTFTFTEATLNRTFIVTVIVDNIVATSSSKEDDDSYKYTTSFNYKIPSLSGYSIISPSNMITDPVMAWSYSGGTFTFSNGAHTMTFANLGTNDSPQVAFWIDANTLEVVTYNEETCNVTQTTNSGTTPAYTIFKKN